MAIIEQIAAFQADLQSWRHDLHAHPEICYEEVWTSDYIAARLAEMEITCHRGMAKTGVVGVLHGKQNTSGRAIGLRADMDALPMPEANEFAHKSKIENRMHACGHDGHMTMLLGAARHLAQTRNFDGTVYFIFQPAEEGGSGGQAMIDDGLFTTCEMQSVWGMHNWPGLPEGHIAVHDGACMASADHFYLTITGHGGHAAMPHQSADPVLATAAVVQALQGIISRQTDPLDPAVLSITMMEGGTAFNVIPDSVRLGGTARAIQPATRSRLEQSIRTVAEQTAAAHGCTLSVDWRPGYPPTVNHPAEAGRAAQIAANLVGRDKLHLNPPASMGAEDFAFMLQEKPGCYIWLGAGPAETGKMLHNTGYDFNDALLPIGASYWVKLVESELALAE